ncbi:hypothetical protein B0T26DRAFT_640010 [Lasiosphaeria miniovina]|uniref:DNA (cytosine-5)-methyltransferase 1 replication foci domain-containing protein n=1 Tax=Lasiosphaeria miniovina TaxID=1954250 RepID=A0AA40E7W7_9PEZI|nr:uncharacterized protein B0T26DRAFT_640010 [Lasiosphaeria miniovina]KAK0727266.1 hypothetical protein B0T26DRAFT_640010 [Lasiosphaeria miniovina]
MAGRRRRASNSTVGSVEEAQVRWTRESSILRPASLAVPYSNWPCYVLTDAVIYQKDGTTLANPLLVHVEGPMIIRGKLEIDDDLELLANLVKPINNSISVPIEICQSERYSIGYDPLTLWVSGAAGWFEIVPSPKYEAMYSQISEAVTLYYEVLDVYDKHQNTSRAKKKSRKSLAAPTLDDIYFKYAVAVGDGVTRDEVEARCHKWAQFLIAHFPKEVDVNWESTLFSKWIHQSHPELKDKTAKAAPKAAVVQPPPETASTGTANIENALRNTSLPERPSSKSGRPRRQVSESKDVEMSGFGPSQSPQPALSDKGKAKAKFPIETPVPLPAIYHQLADTPASLKPSPAPRDSSPANASYDDPIDRLVDILQEIATEMDVMKTNFPKIHSTIFFKCKIKNYCATKDITRYYSQRLLPHLGPEWKGTPFYDYLKTTSLEPYKPPENITLEEMPAQLVRRMKLSRASKMAPAVELPPAIDLRAKAKKASQKLEEDESDDEFPPSKKLLQPAGRKSGKGAGLRLLSTSKKRPASKMDDEESSSQRRGRKPSKRPYLGTDEDENMEDANETSDLGSLDDPDDDNDTDDDDDPDDDDDQSIGMYTRVPKDAMRVVVHAESIPTMSPSGPNGTWTCDQDGCGYVVRSAEDQVAQEIIAGHFRDHEAQLEKINLAMKESRGHMPIKYAYFPPVLLIVYFPPSPQR